MTRAEYLRTAGVNLTYVLALLQKAGDAQDLADRVLAVKRDLIVRSEASDVAISPCGPIGDGIGVR